jgi:hypothetical protein
MKPFHFLLFALVPLFAPATEYPEPIGRPTARSFPYSMIGQLLYASGSAGFLSTGTVINSRSVLTAGHVLYDPDTGWSTDMLFRRSTYGTTFLNQQYARRMFLLGGYQTVANDQGPDSQIAFAKDIGGLVFRRPLAGGSAAGWIVDPSLLTGPSYNVALGYGGETHSGDELLFVEPEVSFYRSFGAFFENDSILIEPGMSGGPLFAERNDILSVAGVIVSGSEDPVSGGVRALNRKAADFIRTHLP